MLKGNHPGNGCKEDQSWDRASSFCHKTSVRADQTDDFVTVPTAPTGFLR